MSIRGIDFGNAFTKSSKDDIVFKSSYMEGFDSDMNDDSIKVELDGEKYTIGVDRDKGIVDVNVNTRYDSKLHELCILTSLALSFDETDIKTAVVVGVPADNYEALKDSVKAKVLSYSNKTIKLVKGENTEIKLIQITNVIVMPQSAVVFLNTDKYRESTNFVLDIGGGTAIASIWRGLKLFKARTLPMGGMLRLFTSLAQNLNKELITDYNTETVQQVLKIQEIKDGQGTKYSIEDPRIKKIIDNTIEKHTSQIISGVEEVLGLEPIQANTQTLIGGGALSDLVKPHLVKAYKELEATEKPQFVNAKVYESIGKAKKIDMVK